MFKRSHFDRVFPVAVFLFCVLLVVSTLRGRSSYSVYSTLQQSKDKLEGSVQELRQEAADLKREIGSIAHSKAYARRVYKDKYHVVDSKESIVFFAE